MGYSANGSQIGNVSMFSNILLQAVRIIKLKIDTKNEKTFIKMSEEKLLNIKSRESQTIDILNKIYINKIAVYGEEVQVILNRVIANECVLLISLVGERKEIFELNLVDLIKPSDDYSEWKLCIFEIKNNITFPNIHWGKEYNGIENKIKIEFKANNDLTVGVFYTVENYNY